MRERVGLEGLEPALAALRDHLRIEIDAVAIDLAILQQVEEDPPSATEVEHALLALVQVDERLGLLADDRLVAAEARLEVDGVEVRGDLVVAPLLPLPPEPPEALAEFR